MKGMMGEGGYVKKNRGKGGYVKGLRCEDG